LLVDAVHTVLVGALAVSVATESDFADSLPNSMSGLSGPGSGSRPSGVLMDPPNRKPRLSDSSASFLFRTLSLFNSLPNMPPILLISMAACCTVLAANSATDAPNVIGPAASRVAAFWSRSQTKSAIRSRATARTVATHTPAFAYASAAPVHAMLAPRSCATRRLMTSPKVIAEVEPPWR